MYTNNYSYKYFCCCLAHRNVQCLLRALVTLQTVETRIVQNLLSGLITRQYLLDENLVSQW